MRYLRRFHAALPNHADRKEMDFEIGRFVDSAIDSTEYGIGFVAVLPLFRAVLVQKDENRFVLDDEIGDFFGRKRLFAPFEYAGNPSAERGIA